MSGAKAAKDAPVAKGLGYTEPHTEPGWVDAACVCGDPAAHAGLFCPERSPDNAVVNPEFQTPEPQESPTVALARAKAALEAAQAAHDAAVARAGG